MMQLTKVERGLERLTQRLARLGWVNALFAAAAALAPALWTFGVGGALAANLWARLAALAAVTLLGALALRSLSLAQRKSGAYAWLPALGLAAALAGTAYVALGYGAEISDYPLTLGWSETSRYYYASLFFADRIYGVEAPPTVLHPSRYFLQALPFLIPGATLIVHRAWQVFLWLGMSALAATLLARRMALPTWSGRVALSAGLFLLFMSGPVYYHLLPAFMLVVAVFRPGNWRIGSRPWLLNLLAVVLASAWAGVSRINWFPVPAMLAVLLILLEEPLLPSAAVPAVTKTGRIAWDSSVAPDWRAMLRLIGRALAWGLLGMGVALTAQAGYIVWSGNAAEQFTTSFSSDLLWSRLLPNPTYPPGIFLASLLVTLPIVLVAGARWLAAKRALTDSGGRNLRGNWPLHPLRLLGMVAILGVLFAGGLVVSVKIGGGSNIHNMDAYLVALGVLGAYAACGLPASARTALQGERLERLAQVGMTLSLVILAGFGIMSRGPFGRAPDLARTQPALQEVVRAAERTAEQGGEVLFLVNRHLLTFGDVQGVKLEPDYERVFLMEMAMSRDPVGLARLQAQLKAHRWQLIISEPLSTQLKDPGEVFWAENNVWVDEVAQVILCYYAPVKTLRDVQMQLLRPRAEPKRNCP